MQAEHRCRQHPMQTLHMCTVLQHNPMLTHSALFTTIKDRLGCRRRLHLPITIRIINMRLDNEVRLQLMKVKVR